MQPNPELQFDRVIHWPIFTSQPFFQGQKREPQPQISLVVHETSILVWIIAHTHLSDHLKWVFFWLSRQKEWLWAWFKTTDWFPKTWKRKDFSSEKLQTYGMSKEIWNQSKKKGDLHYIFQLFPQPTHNPCFSSLILPWQSRWITSHPRTLYPTFPRITTSLHSLSYRSGSSPDTRVTCLAFCSVGSITGSQDYHE